MGIRTIMQAKKILRRWLSRERQADIVSRAFFRRTGDAGSAGIYPTECIGCDGCLR